MRANEPSEKEQLVDDRVFTSAITYMSGAEVRKALAHMRREWYKHSTVQPFFPCQILPQTNMMVSEFAFRFVMGHHHKRHQKTERGVDIREEGATDVK